MKLDYSRNVIAILSIFVIIMLNSILAEDIRFLLNPGASQKELIIDDPSSLKGLQTYKGAKILIHGFIGACSEPGYTAISNAYQKKKPNFAPICVDWAPLAFKDNIAAPLMYPQAVKNTITVGKRTAEFIKFLIKEKVVPSLDTVHIIGFSLGAHTAGVAGNALGGAVGRITGLDPAGPLFPKEKATSERLDKSDAKYVDVIHTSAGKMGTDLFNIGHADFLPHGGKDQPKCTDTGDFDTNIIEFIGACSHMKALTYWTKSIQTPIYASACKCASWEQFEANKCNGCKKRVPFGEPSKRGTNGKFYLRVIKG